MIRLWPFTRPSDAGRILAKQRVQSERQLIKAVARQLCEEMKRPVPKVLK